MTNQTYAASLPLNGLHPCNDYYSYTDPRGMEGWVGLVGWPIADSTPFWRSGHMSDQAPFFHSRENDAKNAQMITQQWTNFALLKQRERRALSAGASRATNAVNVSSEQPRNVVRHNAVDVGDIDASWHCIRADDTVSVHTQTTASHSQTVNSDCRLSIYSTKMYTRCI